MSRVFREKLRLYYYHVLVLQSSELLQQCGSSLRPLREDYSNPFYTALVQSCRANSGHHVWPVEGSRGLQRVVPISLGGTRVKNNREMPTGHEMEELLK